MQASPWYISSPLAQANPKRNTVYSVLRQNISTVCKDRINPKRVTMATKYSDIGDASKYSFLNDAEPQHWNC